MLRFGRLMAERQMMMISMTIMYSANELAETVAVARAGPRLRFAEAVDARALAMHHGAVAAPGTPEEFG